MAGELSGRRVAILAADGVERVELERPRQALEDAGARTDVVSIKSGEILARNQDLEDAGTFAVDRLVGAASVDEYDALLLPGGTVNPDKLRMEPAAVQFVRDFVQSGKPVASICHGPWNFVEADVARGRRLTSWPSVRTDLRNAGRGGGRRAGRHRRQHHDEPLARRPTRRSASASCRSSPGPRSPPARAEVGHDPSPSGTWRPSPPRGRDRRPPGALGHRPVGHPPGRRRPARLRVLV
jgi:protease I